MHSRIQLLSEETINQIAAGELIENPASVVKELVENSIDAGGAKIFIEISGGGLQSIRVSDDGCGMSGEEAALCIQRHATSKIGTLKDLDSLSTLGFRGEGLPSIASVSKFRLLTAQENGFGTEIEIEGGLVRRAAPGARSRGTTIEVSSLFYNVPARKKFQKSAAICSAEIIRWTGLLALAHPQIAFELREDGKLVLQAEKTPYLEKRIEQILGDKFSRSLIPIHAVETFCEIGGFLFDPLETRPNRTGQYLFVNSRPVVSIPLSAALRDGYATRIGANRYPLFVIKMKIPPENIDVNVHPQKREIRLKEEERVKGWIRLQVEKALQKVEMIELPPIQKRDTFQDPPISIITEKHDGPIFFSENRSFREVENIPEQQTEIDDFVQPLGIFRYFLFLKEEQHLLMIDLQALESRLIFDAIVSQDSLPKQSLMIPETLFFSSDETEILMNRLDVLTMNGFSIHASGKNSFLVDAIPPLIELSEIEEFIREILQTSEVDQMNVAKIASRFGGARKKNFMLEEGLALMKRAKGLSSLGYCPQGKKIWRKCDCGEIADWISD